MLLLGAAGGPETAARARPREKAAPGRRADAAAGGPGRTRAGPPNSGQGAMKDR